MGIVIEMLYDKCITWKRYRSNCVMISNKQNTVDKKYLCFEIQVKIKLKLLKIPTQN